MYCGIELSEYHGVLDEDAGAELEDVIEERRTERSKTHRRRVEEFAEDCTSNLNGD